MFTTGTTTHLSKISSVFLGFVVMVLFVGVPLTTSAQLLKIPCGAGEYFYDEQGNRGAAKEPCQFHHLLELGKNIIEFLIILIFPLAVIAFAWIGILYMTGRGNTNTYSKAKSIFWSVFIGLLFVLGAWLLVYTILSVLLDPAYVNPLNS